MLYFSSPCSKEHGWGFVCHSNRAKQRKCPIMDWKASEEQSDEREGGEGTRYIYKETLLFVGPPCCDIYPNSSRKVDFLGVLNDSRGDKKKKKSEVGRDVESQQTQTGRNTDTMKGVNRQKTQRIAFLTGFNVSPHPYHLWRREIIRRVEEPLTHTNKVSSRRVLFKLINKQSKIIWGNVLNLKRRRQQSEFKGR